MKLSTALAVQVYIPLLCLVTLHIVTRNDGMASATEMAADTDARFSEALSAARDGLHSSSRKVIHKIHSEQGTPSRRKRDVNPQPHSQIEKPGRLFKPNIGMIVFLIILLVFLILALVYFYKRLNRESDGEYDITKVIGRARECAQNGITTIQSRLGVVWRTPESEGEESGNEDGEEEGSEKQRERDEESQIEGYIVQHMQPEEQEYEDSSDDYSSMEGFNPLERGSGKGRRGKRASQEKKEDKTAEDCTDERKNEKLVEVEVETGVEGNRPSGKAGERLLADLKEFSGSAIWAEEQRKSGEDNCDLTEL